MSRHDLQVDEVAPEILGHLNFLAVYDPVERVIKMIHFQSGLS